MSARFLLDVFHRYRQEPAIIWKDEEYSYGWLLEQIEALTSATAAQCRPGSTVALVSDFSPRSVALLLSLEAMHCTIVPIAEAVAELQNKLIRLSHAESVIRLDGGDRPEITHRDQQIVPLPVARLREAGQSGLVLFTSGTSGWTKVAVHSLAALLQKFRQPRHRRRILSFLLYDHIGGINTLFYTLSNGGTLITVRDRRPETVARTIADHRVELLPTSPTFLNLLLQSGAHRHHDMRSLRLITYGTERMHEDLLDRLNQEFPQAQLQQTYGLSEIGILRSKSENSRSTWVKLGGPEFEVRVVDGLLQVKAESAMVGYTNAPSPFTEDGWFLTGDRVEEKGEYLRILGRASDIINAGGLKVDPAEVESVLLADPQVVEAHVYGERTYFGIEVCADIRLASPEPVQKLFPRLRRLCAAHLSAAKAPTKINVVDSPLHNRRFKTVSPGGAPTVGPRLGFVISGQGPVWPETGAQLLAEEPIFRTTIEEFDDALRPLADWSLSELLASDSGKAALGSTDKGQPAHFAFQVGLARLWTEWGFRLTAVVGHSMGEIAAAHLAGALSFKDAVKVAFHRAAFTQAGAGKGKMAAVSLSLAAAEEELRPWQGRLSVCAHNEPPSCVVAGETEALITFLATLEEKGVDSILFGFDYAFHSPVMWPFREPLTAHLEGITPRRAKIPIASTVFGRFVHGEELGAEYWGENICQPVRFVEGLNLLMDAACDAFIEIGPHSLLVGSIHTCLAHRGYKAPVHHSLRRYKPDLSEIYGQRAELARDLELL